MLGVATLACDMAKGALPVLAAWLLLKDGDPVFQWVIALTGLVAFLGHLFPVYTGFKQGGKGVATAAGVFLIIAPMALVGSLVVFALAVGISRRASVGSLAASASLCPLAYWYYQLPNYPILAGVIGVLVWIKHRENIKRLFSGQEPKIF